MTISGILNSDIDNTKYVQYISNVSKDYCCIFPNLSIWYRDDDIIRYASCGCSSDM